MYCQKCGNYVGYAQFCSSCGTAAQPSNQAPYQPYPYAPQPQAQQTNSLAIAGLVLSIAAPVVGLIVSIIARKQCRENGEDGEKYAKAGIIIGAISCAFIAVSIVLMLLAAFSVTNFGYANFV